MYTPLILTLERCKKSIIIKIHLLPVMYVKCIYIWEVSSRDYLFFAFIMLELMCILCMCFILWSHPIHIYVDFLLQKLFSWLLLTILSDSHDEMWVLLDGYSCVMVTFTYMRIKTDNNQHQYCDYNKCGWSHLKKNKLHTSKLHFNLLKTTPIEWAKIVWK